MIILLFRREDELTVNYIAQSRRIEGSVLGKALSSRKVSQGRRKTVEGEWVSSRARPRVRNRV